MFAVEIDILNHKNFFIMGLGALDTFVEFLLDC